METNWCKENSSVTQKMPLSQSTSQHFMVGEPQNGWWELVVHLVSIGPPDSTLKWLFFPLHVQQPHGNMRKKGHRKYQIFLIVTDQKEQIWNLQRRRIFHPAPQLQNAFSRNCHPAWWGKLMALKALTFSFFAGQQVSLGGRKRHYGAEGEMLSNSSVPPAGCSWSVCPFAFLHMRKLCSVFPL